MKLHLNNRNIHLFEIVGIILQDQQDQLIDRIRSRGLPRCAHKIQMNNITQTSNINKIIQQNFSSVKNFSMVYINYCIMFNIINFKDSVNIVLKVHKWKNNNLLAKRMDPRASYGGIRSWIDGICYINNPIGNRHKYNTMPPTAHVQAQEQAPPCFIHMKGVIVPVYCLIAVFKCINRTPAHERVTNLR